MARIPDEHLRSVAKYLRLTNYDGDAVVFRRGRPATRFYIVRTGCVALCLEDQDATTSVIRLVGPGEAFGELCFVERAAYPVTAQTVGPCRLIEIQAAPLRDAIQRQPEIALAMLSEVSQRLLTLVHQIADLKMKTAVERVGSYLAGLLTVSEGPAEIPLPFEKKLLASHLGMQPETLSRALLKLQAAGVTYAADRHAFVVRDVRRLQRFHDSDGGAEDDAPLAPPPAAIRHPPGCRSGMPTAGDRALVQQTPLLAALAAPDLDRLFTGASVHEYTDGGSLFQAGDRCDRLFVVAAGGVRLFALSGDGCESTIDIVGPGTMFAEAALFTSGRYPVNADALAGARIIALDAGVFRRTLDQTPALGLQMLGSLARWHIHLLAELRQLRDRTPAQRLAGYLLGLEASEGPSSRSRTVRLPMRKALIATRIGIAPESLSRALSRLADLGVHSAGDSLRIDDVDRLRCFAEGGLRALTSIKDQMPPARHRGPPPTLPDEAPMPSLPPRPATPLPEDPNAPPWVAEVVESAAAHLDVRPILAAGREPLPQILALADQARGGRGLIIDAPFPPLPLERLLARRGFATYCVALGPDHWRLLARRQPTSHTAAASAEGDDAIAPHGSVDLDLRGLPPPKPLVAILALIDDGKRPDGFSVRLDREPVLLFAELTDRGWSWQRLGGETDDIRYRLMPAPPAGER